MREEVACEWVGGGFHKLKFFIGGYINVELQSTQQSQSAIVDGFAPVEECIHATHTLLLRSTTIPPLICALFDDLLEHDAMRLAFWPRCLSFALFLCPCRTASVVPMMAGHAAIEVRIPKTIFSVSGMYINSMEDTTIVYVKIHHHDGLS